MDGKEELGGIFGMFEKKPDQPGQRMQVGVKQGEPTVLQHKVEPIVTEKRLWNLNYVFLALFLGIVGIVIEFVAVAYFDFDRLNAIILGAIIVVVYAVILFFLLEPKMLREVKTTEITHVEKPVYREVVKTVEKPVEVVKTIEKPVYIEKPVVKEVVRTVTRSVPVVKKVYIEKERKKLNIPVYNYLGSSETKTYHKHGCRFSKLIKKKYKVSNNSASYFKSRKYSPCEICILKTKKV